MRTPAGTECPHYYEDFHRGRSTQECRLIDRNPQSLPWTEAVCEKCSVPAIVRAIAEQGTGALAQPASELMTREVVTCGPDDHVADLMGIMTEKRIRHLPVVSEGTLLGIISIGDVVRCRVQEIESEAEALRTYVTQG